MSNSVQQLPTTGFLRLNQIIGGCKTNPITAPLIPVSRSTWYAGVKSGKFPAPVKAFGGRASFYRTKDIQKLIDLIGSSADILETDGHE